MSTHSAKRGSISPFSCKKSGRYNGVSAASCQMELKLHLSIQDNGLRCVEQLTQLRDNALEMLTRIVDINGLLILPDLDEAVYPLICCALVRGVHDVTCLRLGFFYQFLGQLTILANAILTDYLLCYNLNHTINSSLACVRAVCPLYESHILLLLYRIFVRKKSALWKYMPIYPSGDGISRSFWYNRITFF